MRFLADGPSIPDELLIARDEGAVIFFCGAGVSRAYAGLPDFWGLTQAVIKELGVDSLDEARRLVDLARRIELDEGIVGLISADRIFGLLNGISPSMTSSTRLQTPYGHPKPSILRHIVSCWI